MITIESPFAEIALWRMAEYQPKLLLEMYAERPLELLKRIVHKVENALDWKETAIKNGANIEEVNELMLDLLNPSYCSPNAPHGSISEAKMAEIRKTLTILSKSRN